MNDANTSGEKVCPICGGTGWRDIMRGDVREVTRCDCRLKGRAERLLQAAKFPARYEHCELGTFRYDPENPEDAKLGTARLAAGRFVEEYPVEKTGLLFVGSVGTGKTHLAVGILKALIRDKGVPCLFCDYRELLKSIQNSFNASVRVTETEILRPVFDAEVLVIDELGAVRSTEWVFDTVNYILNSRYNENKTTIITTNFPDKPEQERMDDRDTFSQASAEKAARRETLGDRIGERMRSRLHEMCRIVEVSGRDYRQGPKKAPPLAIGTSTRLNLKNKKPH
jgi:DNA replication protein DnaC